MKRHDDLAARSWTHLRRSRELVRSWLPERLDDPDLLAQTGEVAIDARRLAEQLPERLTDGNIAAAIAGHVVAHQHDCPDLDAAAILASALEAAGGRVAAAVEICRLERSGSTAAYYRRRNCCLRDRLPGQHRCDTCSLRPRHELDEMVHRALEKRHSNKDDVDS